MNDSTKLTVRTGHYANVWLAAFFSVAVIVVLALLFLFALCIGQSAELTGLLIPILYILTATWLPVLLFSLFNRTAIEVNETGIIKRAGKKILWHIEWQEAVMMSYDKLYLLWVLSPTFNGGDVVITYKHALIKRKTIINYKNDGNPAVHFSVFPRQAAQIQALAAIYAPNLRFITD